ncbi:MAG TPA: AI-2E family transporter, partial [Gammaproteobacteria bacterium]|nr:AI-2E family transporter [Gammaproteobacteria bacterium]
TPSMPAQNPTPPSPEDLDEPPTPAERRVRSGAVIGILVLMILYTAYFAAPILIPMALAFLLSLLLSPAVGWLARLRIPRVIGAALVLALLLVGFGAAIYGLSAPATHWVKEAPEAIAKIEKMFHSVNGSFNELQKATQKVESLPATNPPASETPRPVKVVNANPGLVGEIFATAPDILAGVGIAIVLLYFLLAASDSFLRSLAHVVPRWSDKKRVVEVARGIQRHISAYLLTITLINLTLGLVDGLILWALGMPNPILWGAMIAIFNYVPYVGAATAIVVLTLIALLNFDGLGHVIVVPAAILAVAILEGQFLTPRIVGRRLVLSPVAVFLALVVCGWIWGIAGAIMAVPFLASFKIMCEEIEPLRPIAQFLTLYSIHRGRMPRDDAGVE